MFEDSYRRAYDAVSPPQELVADVIAQARKEKAPAGKYTLGTDRDERQRLLQLRQCCAL